MTYYFMGEENLASLAGGDIYYVVELMSVYLYLQSLGYKVVLLAELAASVAPPLTMVAVLSLATYGGTMTMLLARPASVVVPLAVPAQTTLWGHNSDTRFLMSVGQGKWVSPGGVAVSYSILSNSFGCSGSISHYFEWFDGVNWFYDLITARMDHKIGPCTFAELFVLQNALLKQIRDLANAMKVRPEYLAKAEKGIIEFMEFLAKGGQILK
jgi:hypothetical protein